VILIVPYTITITFLINLKVQFKINSKPTKQTK